MRVALVSLPRWFSLPVSTSAIVLGGIISGASIPALALATAIGMLLMAYSHTMNSWIDYVMTGFDRGATRSKKKPYTSAQNLIEDGISSRFVLESGAAYALGALALTLVAHALYGPLVWVPVLITIPLTFAYSYGKKLYLCELVLFLGFGPLAALLGASLSESPRIATSMLAAAPVGLMFGFAAEAYDQWYDAEKNWDRGLRNIGALVWKHKLNIVSTVTLLSLTAYVTQIALVLSGVLDMKTLISLLTLPALLIMIRLGVYSRYAVLAALGALSLYCVLIPIG